MVNLLSLSWPSRLRVTTFLLTTFTLTPALFAADLNGVFMIVKGDVKVGPKGGGTPVPAKVGTKLNVGDTIISGADSRGKVVMSDRNVINISPDTKLVLNKYENNPTTGDKNVEMQLIAGKVRNNVEQTYDGEKSKFMVKTPTAVAGVRGTQFVTAFNPVTMATSVVTLKGAVNFAAVNAQGKTVGTPVTIEKGQTASASNGAPAEPPKTIPKEDLKKVDSESTANNKNSESSSSQAKNDSAPGKSESASDKKDASPEGPKESKQADTTKPGGEKKGPEPTSDSRGPASEMAAPGPLAGPGAPGSGPSTTMIDSKDMDLGMARDIKNPITATAPPPPNYIPKAPVTAPPPNPILTEIIRNSNNRVNLIVRPVQVGQ